MGWLEPDRSAAGRPVDVPRRGKWPERKWEALPAQVDASGRVTATLPQGVTVYYLNVFDDRDCVASTEHEELVKEAPSTD